MELMYTKGYIITSLCQSVGVKLSVVNEKYKTKVLGTEMRNTP